MSSIVKLLLEALIPVIASVILYFGDKKTDFGKLGYWKKQWIYGVIFGGIAIIGTEFGISVVGVTMNVRDAAPICSGLIFGAPSGIIAGLIGGIERYIAASWGAGEYTRIACSMATIFAGFFAALLRKYIFENKSPAWYYGLVAGAVIEVFHMLMVFFTNMKDTVTAFTIVQKCTVPMVLLSAFSVMLATLIISVIEKKEHKVAKRQISVSETFQRKLFVCCVIAFFSISLFTYTLQTRSSLSDTQNLLELNIKDVKADIYNFSDINLLNITRDITNEIDYYGQEIKLESLNNLARKYNVSEINLIDSEGIITESTNGIFVNYDMKSGKQSNEFMVVLNGKKTEFVQDYQPTSYDPSTYRKYAAKKLKSGGMVQVGYSAEYFQTKIASQIVNTIKNRHIRKNGFFIICDKYFNIINGNDNIKNSINNRNEDLNIFPNKMFESVINGENVYCMYDQAEGYYVVAVIPKSETLFSRDLSVYIAVYMEMLLFTVLFIFIFILINKHIVSNIKNINRSLGIITNGNLDEVVDVRNSYEFTELSNGINSTVDSLKKYIKEAEERIDKELEFSRTIQVSALPRVFPPYPNRDEFDIWAGMRTAKEVGGDFYDFYLLSDDKLAFIIADVSGKGIPAAMFMMTAKTMLKSFAESGTSVNDVFTHANDQLCANNDAQMFVTAWMGIVDLKTGVTEFANAGHNAPLIRKNNGDFEYLKSKPGFVLAGMEGIQYRSNEVKLEPGDIIFLYTDGITEATNANNCLYGEERLLKFINTQKEKNSHDLCNGILNNVDSFVGEAPQFDDMTMLCLEFKKYKEN